MSKVEEEQEKGEGDTFAKHGQVLPWKEQAMGIWLADPEQLSREL